MSLVLIATCSAVAQQTTYSQEDSTITTGELKRFYRYITRANVEEKTLFKLGFWPNAGDRDFTGRPSFRIGLNADVSVERKITPSFSVLAGFDFMLRYNQFRKFNVPYDNFGNYTDTDKIYRGFMYAKIGTRYYYGMAKNIRKGNSANNFSGSYLGFQLTKVIINHAVNHIYDTRTGETVRTENYNGVSSFENSLAVFTWGMQRRLGRRGFIDINAGPEMTIPNKKPNPVHITFFENNNKPTFSLRVNAVIGLGW